MIIYLIITFLINIKVVDSSEDKDHKKKQNEKFEQLSSKKILLTLKNLKIIKNLIKKNHNIFDSKAIYRIKDIIMRI